MIWEWVMWRLHMARITIDGKEFDTEQLPEEGRRKLGAIQFVDRRMNHHFFQPFPRVRDDLQL
jgi:hypothetical protein